jgi:hypothetical protein
MFFYCKPKLLVIDELGYILSSAKPRTYSSSS